MAVKESPSACIAAEETNVAKVMLMPGDPLRAKYVAEHYLEDPVCFNTVRNMLGYTGTYKGKRITVLSHGIGTDNIDIVITELDALANLDFETRQVKEQFRQLSMVRIGTSGALQPELAIGTPVIAEKSIGFDGVLNYYANREKFVDLDFQEAFTKFVNWNPLWATPYVVDADPDLVAQIGKDDMVRGNTISAVGFYGPQGREVRLPLAHPTLNSFIEKFNFNGRKITNYEMESAPLQGLGKMMGHRCMTVCSIIANRMNNNANPNYKTAMHDLVKTVLERI